MDSSQAAPLELGTQKIGKLLRDYAVPGIIAQVAASLYNIVDSIYIGHITGVGAAAISGLAVTFPLMNISIALGTLVGVGAMTLISVLLGQKDYPTARKALANTLSLNVIIGIVFTIVSIAFLNPILRFFGASDVTLPFARDYMLIILAGNAISHLMHGFNGIIRASGHPKTAMTLTLFTVVFNIIIDPLFIFVLDMGIAGAALATVLCQILSLAYTMWFLSDKKRLLHFPRPLFQFDWKIAKMSLEIGISPFLMNVAACIVALFINQQMGRYGGDFAIGAYGIVNRFTLFFVMICMGFNQGLQPIAGYNYGARKYSRVREVFLLTAKLEVAVTTVCFLIAEFCPEFAVGLFTNDPTLLRMGTRGLRIMDSGFALVGIGMVTSNLFQCLGMVKQAVFLSLSRQLLFLLPLIYTLPLWLREDGVWLGFPISDLASVIVSVIFVLALFRKLRRLQDGEDPSILGSNIE